MKTKVLKTKRPCWSNTGELSLHQLLDEIIVSSREDPAGVRQLFALLLRCLETLLGPGPKQISPESAGARRRYLAPLRSFKGAVDRPDLTMPELVSLTEWLRQKIDPVPQALLTVRESIEDEQRIKELNEKFKGTTPMEREIVRKLGARMKQAIRQRQEGADACPNESNPSPVQPQAGSLPEPSVPASSTDTQDGKISGGPPGTPTVSKPTTVPSSVGQAGPPVAASAPHKAPVKIYPQGPVKSPPVIEFLIAEAHERGEL